MMDSREAGDRAQLLRAEAGIYGLLARVFGARPSINLVRGMKDQQMLEALEPFGFSFDDDFLSAEDGRQSEELVIEYTRLFVGPGPHIAAYESVYVPAENEAEPRLWGRAATSVAEFYRELGLELPEGQMPDHLSLELEAMAVLSQSQADRLTAGDVDSAGTLATMQKKFCSEHLLRWVPAVCNDIRREATSSFYGEMASLAAGLVEMTCGEEEPLSEEQAKSGNIQEEEALNENT